MIRIRPSIPSIRAALACAAVLLMAAPSLARPPHGPMHGPPPGALLDFHADELGLDEAARQRIHEIVESSRLEGEALRDRMREERGALHELMGAEPVDREAVMRQVERIAEVRLELEKHRIGTMLAIRDELSPEQRQALVELGEGMRQHHLGPILAACEADLETLCPDEGGPRGVHCLLGHRDALSPECATVVDEMPRPFHHPGDDSHGHGKHHGDGWKHHGDHGRHHGGRDCDEEPSE